MSTIFGFYEKNTKKQNDFYNKDDLRKALRSKFNYKKNEIKNFLYDNVGFFYKIKNNHFSFYGIEDFFRYNIDLILEFFLERSQEKDKTKKLIDIISFSKNLVNRNKRNFSYEDLSNFYKKYKKEDLKKYYDISPEIFKFSYGGIITDNGDIYKVNFMNHIDFLEKYFNIKTYEEAFKKNLIRFITQMYPDTFYITGKKQNILKFFNKWINFALLNKNIIVEIINNNGDIISYEEISNGSLKKKNIYNIIKNM